MEAGYKEISMDEEICGQNVEDFTLHDVLADDSVDVEQEAIKRCELSRLKAALKHLETEEMELITALFLTDNPLNEREYAERLGVSQPAINKQKKMIIEKIRKNF